MTLPILPPRGGHHLVELHRQALFTLWEFECYTIMIIYVQSCQFLQSYELK